MRLLALALLAGCSTMPAALEPTDGPLEARLQSLMERVELETPWAIAVTVGPLEGLRGQCAEMPWGMLVTIDEDTPVAWADAVLCHELAHAFDGNRDGHGETWGVWFSRVYRDLRD